MIESSLYVPISELVYPEKAEERYYVGILVYRSLLIAPSRICTFSLGAYVKTEREAVNLLDSIYDTSCYRGVVIDRLRERIVMSITIDGKSVIT